MTLVLTPGQRHEAVVLTHLLETGAVKRRGSGRLKRRPHRVIGDNGYSREKRAISYQAMWLIAAIN